MALPRFALRERFIGKRANLLVEAFLRHRIICRRIFRHVARHRPAFRFPFVAAAIENFHFLVSEQPKRPKRITRPPVRLVAVENAGGVGRDAVAAAKLGKFFRLRCNRGSPDPADRPANRYARRREYGRYRKAECPRSIRRCGCPSSFRCFRANRSPQALPDARIVWDCSCPKHRTRFSRRNPPRVSVVDDRKRTRDESVRRQCCAFRQCPIPAQRARCRGRENFPTSAAEFFVR